MGGRGPVVPRWAVGLLLVLALVVALYALGRGGGSNPPPRGDAVDDADDAGRGSTTAAQDDGPQPGAQAGGSQSTEVVALWMISTGPVNMCLVGDGGTSLIKGKNSRPGETRRPVTQRVEITLGNSAVTMHVNGKPR